VYSTRQVSHIDTGYVDTYYVGVNITLSVEDEVVERARHRAEALGTSLNQMVREYLAQVAGKTDAEAEADEFDRLSRLARGNSRGWKFDRDELHDRS
jgi:hypothetical protein